MNQKERLEQIRKKHEEERNRRKILFHRIIFAAAAVIAVLAVVFMIIGCARFISGRIEAKKQEQAAIEALEALQASPEPTPSYTINPRVISQQYYSNSAFIGNSFAEDLYMLNLLEDADYFAKVGLSVDQAMTDSTGVSGIPVIEELNQGSQYSKVFMIFGENELGWASADAFTDKYGKLIDKVKEYQPKSEIYLLAITPVNEVKVASVEDGTVTNNERIQYYNDLIKRLATEKGVIFADIYAAVADKNGELPENAASDGVHFGKDYYEKCLLYIQNNYQTVL